MKNPPKPDAKPQWDRWIIFVLVAIPLGILMFVFSTVILTQQRVEHEQMIAAQTAESAAAARVALEKANHDRAFLFAICRALNRRDQVSAWTTRELSQLEQRYHSPRNMSGTEAAYYAARERILSRAVNARAAIASFDCVRGMTIAVKEAPTNAPIAEVSATP